MTDWWKSFLADMALVIFLVSGLMLFGKLFTVLIEDGAIQHAQGKITCELVQQPDMTTEWECERHD